jgi:hypothetical protein
MMRSLATPIACRARLPLPILLVGCRKRNVKQNQRTPLVSPSGAYVLKMPVEKVSGRHYWRLEIGDTSGNLLYKDNEGFPARFNVYWCWEQPRKILPKASSSSGDPNEKVWPGKYGGNSKKNWSELPVARPVPPAGHFLQQRRIEGSNTRNTRNTPFRYPDYVREKNIE